MSKRILALKESLNNKKNARYFKRQKVILKERSFFLTSLKIPLFSFDLLSFLKAQILYPKVYFDIPSKNLKIGAFGSALKLNKPPSFISIHASFRFYGGFDFSRRKNKNWKGIPSCFYFLPSIEVEELNGQVALIIHQVDTETIDQKIAQIKFEDTPLTAPLDKPQEKRLFPSYGSWKNDLDKTLSSIQNKEFEKVVLARSCCLQFKTPLFPLDILQKLKKKSLASNFFAFQFTPKIAFIGASPEILYERTQRSIKTAAIAGTRKRGITEDEDRKFQEELLKNDKELREFNIVKKDIKKKLTKLCESFSMPDHHQIIQTTTVQHLFCPFKGNLKETVQDKDLLKTLHPTPALGGYPKKKALIHIQNIERFDRGWYGAPLGWISKENAYQIVAIRSALIQSHHFTLFSGTGIVKGSDPQREWQELEDKISQFFLWKT